MYGEIAKSDLTKTLLREEPTVYEVYVRPDFDWSDNCGEFYILGKGTVPITSILNRLQAIWGAGNCRVCVTYAFDSLLLANKRLVYNSGKWVGV